MSRKLLPGPGSVESFMRTDGHRVTAAFETIRLGNRRSPAHARLLLVIICVDPGRFRY